MVPDRILHRDQNLVVAEKVFGMAWVRTAEWAFHGPSETWLCVSEPPIPAGGQSNIAFCLPKYCQDMDPAMTVVGRMLNLDFDFELRMAHNKPPYVSFFHKRPGIYTASGVGSVPALICKAALEAIAEMGRVPA